MKCAYVRSQLTGYLERMCAKSEVAAMARHIELCPSCAQELRDLQRVKSMLHRVRNVQADPVFLSDLRTLIHERTTYAHLMPGLKAHLRTSGGRRLRYILATAAILIVSALTISWPMVSSPSKPTAKTPPVHDDMTFILQEHALQADQNVFSNGALGSVMVNYPRKNSP